MDILLDHVEVRILGVLIEKQMATPDYYPLTLNALVNGCNQKTNREPVMHLTSDIVEAALGRLRDRRLVLQVKTQGSRTLKYEHSMKTIAAFSDRQLGILCVLLLRGAQTVGELRSKTTRLVEFHGLAAVEHTLQKLMENEQGPFVLQLKRGPGQKENRYTHLFCETAPPERPVALQTVQNSAGECGANESPIVHLQKQIDDLKRELATLKAQFQDLYSQLID